MISRTPTLAIIVFIVIAGGCDSSESEDRFMSARLNGQPWEAEPDVFVLADTALFVGGSVIHSCRVASPCFRLRLIIDGYIDGDEVGEPGTYPVRNASYAVLHGDVVSGAFDAEEGGSSFQVTSYDAATRTLKGEFESTLYRDDSFPPVRGLPDTLRFTGGVFEALLAP